MELQAEVILQNMQPFLSVMIGGFALATLLILITFSIFKCFQFFNL